MIVRCVRGWVSVVPVGAITREDRCRGEEKSQTDGVEKERKMISSEGQNGVRLRSAWPQLATKTSRQRGRP